MLIIRSAVGLACLHLAQASPTAKPKTSHSHNLMKRYNTIIDCGASLKEPDPDLNGPQTQADFLNRASADMAVLANHGFYMPADSPAFRHYFLDVDYDRVKRTFSAIGANNDPTNSPYDFTISCAPDLDCTEETYALTDSRPEENGPRTMTICPAFWDAEWAEVNRLLPMLPNEGEKPDPNLYDQWCKIEDEDWKAITPNYRTFVTPGHVLLHEVTHLDKVGAFLEWPPDTLGSRGSFDYDTFQGSKDLLNDPFWQARQLQVLFNQAPDRTDTGDPVVTPGRNAESLAGTGTENYFMKFCNVPHIAPENGVGPNDVNDDPEDDPDWDLPNPPGSGS